MELGGHSSAENFLSWNICNCWSKQSWEFFQEKLQPFPQVSSLFSSGAMDSTTVSHLVLWEGKRGRKTCMHNTQDADTLTLFSPLTSGARKSQRKLFPCREHPSLRSSLVDEGGALFLALLERHPDLVPTGGEGWECRARDWSPGQEQRLCATVPGNNYLIPMLWVCLSQGWGHMCEPVWYDSKALCLCVCSGGISLLHSTSQLSAF